MNRLGTSVARAVAGGASLGIVGAILGVIWGGATAWGMGSAALWLGVIGAVVGLGLGQEIFRGRASASLRRLTGGTVLAIAGVGIVVWIITAAVGGAEDSPETVIPTEVPATAEAGPAE